MEVDGRPRRACERLGKEPADTTGEGGRVKGGETRRGEQDSDNWQRVQAAFTTRQAAQLELKAPLRHNEDVAAN